MHSKKGSLAQPSANLLRTSSHGFSRVSIQSTAAVLLLMIAILLSRVMSPDRLVTPDEAHWLTRSGNFYYALTRGDFADTYQIEHPGVLTMWAGMFAFVSHYPTYSDQVPGQLNRWGDYMGAFLRSRGYDPMDLLIASRVNMVILITVVLIAAFWAASRLLGFWPALIGFLLIAMDPFHTALSRLLHVDGLPSSLALLSLLPFFNYLYRGRQKSDLVLSGIAAGLAWLTKSPMLFLIPFVGLLMFLELVEKWRMQLRLIRNDLWQFAIPLILWGSVGLAVFVLLWPSMWVDPVHTLRRMLGGMVMYAGQGHDSQLYFNGEVYEGDPGDYFYPITYLWRTTPVVLLGMVLAALALAFPKAELIPFTNRRPLGMLLLFALLFTIFMTLGAKKFDRYLLPIYPPLDLVAGMGWVAAVKWIRQRWPETTSRVATPALLLAALVGQAVGTASSYPYYFSYYNPLLGGTVRAPEVMMVGWGEGLDQAARFLNNQPGANERQVATGVWMTTFSYFYKGPVLTTRFEPGATTIQDWMDSDYYVLYINEVQREKVSRELIDYFAALRPIHVVRINGLDYAYIYDIRDLPPPDFLNLTPTSQIGESEMTAVGDVQSIDVGRWR
jgi:hypothetical protein